MRWLSIFFLLLFSSLAFGQSTDHLLGTTKMSGTVESIDQKTAILTIDKKPYMLTDALVVYNFDGSPSNRFILSPGQKIVYWINYASGSTMPMINQIQVQTAPSQADS